MKLFYDYDPNRKVREYQGLKFPDDNARPRRRASRGLLLLVIAGPIALLAVLWVMIAMEFYAGFILVPVSILALALLWKPLMWAAGAGGWLWTRVRPAKR